jgi:hypothetical protein
MTRKPRKSLNDVLANEFVYDADSESSESTVDASSAPTADESEPKNISKADISKQESQPEPKPTVAAAKPATTETAKTTAAKKQTSRSPQRSRSQAAKPPATRTASVAAPELAKTPPKAATTTKITKTSRRIVNQPAQTKQRRKVRYPESAGLEANVMLKLEMPGSLYKKLAIAAEKTGKRKPEIIRQLISDHLDALIAEVDQG